MVPVRSNLLHQSTSALSEASWDHRSSGASGWRRVYAASWDAVGHVQVPHIRTKKDISSYWSRGIRMLVLLSVARLLWMRKQIQDTVLFRVGSGVPVRVRRNSDPPAGIGA